MLDSTPATTLALAAREASIHRDGAGPFSARRVSATTPGQVGQ